MMEMKAEPTAKFATVAQLAQCEKAFSAAALRALIFNAKRNGLEPAIRRLGRRVLIDVPAFREWVDREGGA